MAKQIKVDNLDNHTKVELSYWPDDVIQLHLYIEGGDSGVEVSLWAGVDLQELKDAIKLLEK